MDSNLLGVLANWKEDLVVSFLFDGSCSASASFWISTSYSVNQGLDDGRIGVIALIRVLRVARVSCQAYPLVSTARWWDISWRLVPHGSHWMQGYIYNKGITGEGSE
jgi:hypothetical protein